jgi:MFS family permease
MMSAYFTANKACVTVVTSLAVASLGDKIGGYNQSSLYGALGLSSLLFANWAVLQFGPKGCLIIDCCSSFILMLGVTAAVYADSVAVKMAGAVGGALVAGTGIAWGWSGQGVYFGRVAERYAALEQMDIVEVGTMLGSYFAGIFLGFEVSFKCLATVLELLWGKNGVWVFFNALALGTTLAMFSIEDMREDARFSDLGQSMKGLMLKKGGAAFRMITTEPKMQLMAGLQFAFGFYMVFLNSYINAAVVADWPGTKFIGLFAALAAVPWVSFFTGTLHDVFGMYSKTAVLCLMTAGFCAISAPFIFMPCCSPANKLWPRDPVPKWAVFLLFFSAGVARSSYEFANRSIVVDFFPKDKEAAMPCIYLFNSLTTVLGFLIFPFFSYHVQASIVVFTALLGLCSYLMALRIWLHERAEAEKKADSYVAM